MNLKNTFCESTIDGFYILRSLKDQTELVWVHADNIECDTNDYDALHVELIQRYEATIY